MFFLISKICEKKYITIFILMHDFSLVMHKCRDFNRLPTSFSFTMQGVKIRCIESQIEGKRKERERESEREKRERKSERG